MFTVFSGLYSVALTQQKAQARARDKIWKRLSAAGAMLLLARAMPRDGGVLLHGRIAAARSFSEKVVTPGVLRARAAPAQRSQRACLETHESRSMLPENALVVKLHYTEL